MSVWIELLCDECAAHPVGEHFLRGRPGPRALRRWAKKRGWVRRGGRDLCPRCKQDPLRTEPQINPTEYE